MAEASLTNKRERGDEAVEKPTKAEEPERRQHTHLRLYGIEIGKCGERTYIRRRQRVLRRLRHSHLQHLPQAYGRLPKVRKINDDQARVARAVLVQPFEELLAIVQRPDSISDKNYVEWARQRLDNVFLFYVTLDKRQMRVAAPGFR